MVENTESEPLPPSPVDVVLGAPPAPTVTVNDEPIEKEVPVLKPPAPAPPQPS
jgi:hypothetical protein